MAELIVGLAKSVVEGALTKAQSAIEEEAKLRQSAQRDLVFITGEFEMMHSFLNVATTERVENKVVMTWVRQVRELAYDVEDCIEFVVHLDTKARWWWRMVPSWCITPPPTALSLEEAVDEIEQLKARVEAVSTRNSRYNLISDSGSKPAVTNHQPIAAGAITLGTTAFNVLAEARDSARRQQGLGDLTRLITKKGKDLQVITVWGTGGDLGMTSIIRKAYNDPEICQNFPCRAWVKLMHPFNPHEFVQRFMAQVYAAKARGGEKKGAGVGIDVLTKMEAMQEDVVALRREFVEEVNTNTYLVVLENLTDMVDWDAVRMLLPDMKNGSWIVVSTQQFEIASLCIGHSYQSLELKQYSPEHSVCAFFKEGSQDYGDKEEKPIVCLVNPNSSLENLSPGNKNAVNEWMTNYPLTGRVSEMNELRTITAKARFKNSHVISVWGIAGIGKSALVRHLYYDRMLLSNPIFQKYSWVDVSHPFNLRDFSRSILSDFLSEKDPINECCELLRQYHCLVVIDDLQSKEEWDLIQAALITTDSKSVIVVITTEASVATYCTKNEEQVFNVKGLETIAAFDLFKKQVHRKKPSCPLNNHNDPAIDKLNLKCRGLPKVIVAIADLLATQTVTLMDTVHSLNDRFMHHLETNPEYDSLQGLFAWMHSYFRDCPDSLKPCIFYLSIFPRDCNIRRRRLVRRWIAEGYSRDSDKKSAEEEGEMFFSMLLELSIIQQIPQLGNTAVNETRMARCQVNGFIREYILSRRMEENLVFELGPNCVLTTQRTGRHLIILRDWARDKIVFESIDFSRLRSMTVFGNWESFFISKSMRLIRVLDLEDASGLKDDDLKKMVKRLRRLKFFSLRGCSEIYHLPCSLGDLRQLQSLDVRCTSIVTLPVNIAKLQKLQYIRAGTTGPASTPPASSSCLPEFRKRRGLIGVEVPRGIGKLTALHTLGVVNVSASGGKAIVEELKKLTQLRKLGVSGINMQNSKEFSSAISGHVHLESLLVRLDKDNQHSLDEISLPWENLQSLKLFGLEDKLPLSISKLDKIRKLDLEMATLVQSDIQILAKLPELCILRLQVQQVPDGMLHFYAEMYGEQLATFKKVKILEIACSSTELHVTFGSKSMKKLELLKIDYSSASYELTGLTNLSELKEVLLKGTNDEAFRAQFANTLANHPKSPTVKLEGLPSSS
ncbi:disease resistance protein Pik-2-like [Triticum urartu]|uniref:Disease resistance protein RPM1 n=2 Tax=Triticum urartu TaxID=4572 RepID=A0A8R7VHT9_TRIUA|nr:disease resistance protein Pik-2-like [Triticum urartu]